MTAGPQPLQLQENSWSGHSDIAQVIKAGRDHRPYLFSDEQRA
jgi:hypothetical protein